MYVSESRGSADKPHLVFSKPSGCKPCTQSGECSGENSADGQHRQINKNTCRAKDHHGDTDLTEVMEKGTDHTDKRDVLFPEQPKEQCHGHETEQTAAQAVGEGYHLPGHHAGDQDTHQKYAQSILPGSIIQKPQRNDIGKSQLDPGDRGERRRLPPPQKSSGQWSCTLPETSYVLLSYKTPFRRPIGRHSLTKLTAL